MTFLRVCLLLLIFANLLVYFWGHGIVGGASAPGEPERLVKQIQPEKVRVVSQLEVASATAAAAATSASERAAAPAKTDSNTEPQAPEATAPQAAPAPAKATSAATNSPACVAVSGLTLEQIRHALAKLKANPGGIKASSHSLGDPDSFWVMYPALPNRAAAERKAAELRALGVTDLFLMGEDTPYPHAISLGLFKSREKADEYLASLRQKGVRMARIVLREAPNARHLLELTGPREAVTARQTNLLANYRGAQRAKCREAR